MTKIIPLKSPKHPEVGAVGGKFANLWRIQKAHLVPEGFCIPCDAFYTWQQAGQTAEMPRSIASEIEAAYGTLCNTLGSRPAAVSIRSSATNEDGTEASYAGQYLTLLNIAGPGNVISGVIQCWQSADAREVSDYLPGRRSGDDCSDIGMAVIVQQMIPSDVSGVAFSIDPISDDSSVVVVNANYGLGVSVVDGTSNPDSFQVDRATLSVTSERRGIKQNMTIADSLGIRAVKVPRLLQKRRSVTHDEVVLVAKTALSLEKRLGYPVDIEWAIYDGTLFMLQARPVTGRIILDKSEDSSREDSERP